MLAGKLVPSYIKKKNKKISEVKSLRQQSIGTQIRTPYPEEKKEKKHIHCNYNRNNNCKMNADIFVNVIYVLGGLDNTLGTHQVKH